MLCCSRNRVALYYVMVLMIRPRSVLLFMSLLCCGKDVPSTGASSSDGLTSTNDGSSTNSVTSPPTTSLSELTGDLASSSEDSISATSMTNTSCASGPCSQEPDSPQESAECHTWNDTCPEGFKCGAFSGDGSCYMSETHCVALSPEPRQLYQSCMVDADWCHNGIDNCAKGLQCFSVDPQTLQGECYARCSGIDFPSTCDLPHVDCIGDDVETLTICAPICSPLGSQCGPGALCAPEDSPPNKFICQESLGGNAAELFEPCKASNGCVAGHGCVSSLFASECNNGEPTCCLPFCNILDQPACPGVDQQCVPWFADGIPLPASIKNVGICKIPE